MNDEKLEKILKKALPTMNKGTLARILVDAGMCANSEQFIRDLRSSNEIAERAGHIEKHLCKMEHDDQMLRILKMKYEESFVVALRNFIKGKPFVRTEDGFQIKIPSLPLALVRDMFKGKVEPYMCVTISRGKEGCVVLLTLDLFRWSETKPSDLRGAMTDALNLFAKKYDFPESCIVAATTKDEQ